MTGWRDLDGMRQYLPLDEWTADRLLAGLVDPDDAPPGYAGLALALGQARGPVEAGELAGRERIVAAVAAAVVDASPPTTISTSPRRRPMISRLLATKVAAATITTALLATGAAAATGSLPAPVQGIVSDAADNVGVNLPDAPSTKAERDATKAEREAARTERKAAHDADLAELKVQREAEKVLHAGEVDASHDLIGAAHAVGKGENASENGDAAHTARDTRLGLVSARQAGEDTGPAGDDTQADEDHGTPASDQGLAGHDRRDEQLGVVATQKAEREALKDQRAHDDADESDDVADDDSDDQGDDDQGDVADADDDSDDVADDDEDEGQGKTDDHDDEHEDEDDDPVTQPAV